MIKPIVLTAFRVDQNFQTIPLLKRSICSLQSSILRVPDSLNSATVDLQAEMLTYGSLLPTHPYAFSRPTRYNCLFQLSSLSKNLAMTASLHQALDGHQGLNGISYITRTSSPQSNLIGLKPTLPICPDHLLAQNQGLV